MKRNILTPMQRRVVAHLKAKEHFIFKGFAEAKDMRKCEATKYIIDDFIEKMRPVDRDYYYQKGVDKNKFI